MKLIVRLIIVTMLFFMFGCSDINDQNDDSRPIDIIDTVDEDNNDILVHIPIEFPEVPFILEDGTIHNNLDEVEYSMLFVKDDHFIMITLDNFITEDYIEEELEKLNEVTRHSRSEIIKEFTYNFNKDFVITNSLDDYPYFASMYEPFVKLHIADLTFDELVVLLESLGRNEMVYYLEVREELVFEHATD